MNMATHLVVEDNGVATVVLNNYMNRNSMGWVILYKGSLQECAEFATAYNEPIDEPDI